MGVLYDYFTAPDDAAAATTLTRSPSDSFPTIDLKGIDPTINLADLEALLTGRTSDEVFEDPDQSRLVAGGDEDDESGVVVLAVPPALVAALERSSDEELRAVAPQWAASEDFWGQWEPEPLADSLVELAELVRNREGRKLYCWMSP